MIQSCFYVFSDRYNFPLIFCLSTFFMFLIMSPSTSTILFFSISVFLLENFLTRSFDVIGFLERYLWTSCSVIVYGDSVFCFFDGGVLEETAPLSSTVSSLFCCPVWWDFLSGEGFFLGDSFLEARTENGRYSYV